MKYKQINLKRSIISGLDFNEASLPYDREDIGEYLWSGDTANIYETSDSDLWKLKILKAQIDHTEGEIKKMELFIDKCKEMEVTLIVNGNKSLS